MRKYTCTIAFALSCTFSTFAQTPFLTQNKLIDAQKVKAAAKAAQSLWKPTHEILYTPNENNEWIKDSEHNYTYDTAGNLLVSLSDDGKQKKKIVSTYDEKGQLLTETTYRTDTGSDELKPRMLKEYTYDPYIYDLATSFYFITISNGDWKHFYGSCYKRTVERDDQGRVTSITKSILEGPDNYVDQIKSLYTYEGTSKAPASYEYQTSNGSTLTTSAKYVDLKWAKNTGEYLGAYSNKWFTEGNFLESATIKSDSYGDILLTATDKGGGSYEVVQTYTDEKLKSQKEIQKYEILDNNGSFKYSDLFYFNTEGNAVTDDDLYQGAISETRYDDHNNIVLYESRNITSAGIDNATIADGIKNEYVYGGEHGEITQTTTWTYSYNDKEYMPDSKVIADKFADVSTGIEHIATTPSDMKHHVSGVYTLQGVKVASSASTPLPHGVYIIDGKKIIK